MTPSLSEIVSRTSWRRYSDSAPRIPADFPADYQELISSIGAGEGFVGNEFFRCYDPAELENLNKSYGFHEYLPQIVLFGSNGCGEAYAFDTRTPGWSVVKVPFIPLEFEYVESVAASFRELMETFVRAHGGGALEVANPELYRMEIDFVQPLCLGGSPTEKKNSHAFELPKHIELCDFWNKTYRVVKEKTLNGT